MAKKLDEEKLQKDDFSLVDLPEAARDPEISKDDFVFTQKDEKVHEQKFQTKPTTFLKDSIKRFAKNKSSVVAAGILGGLLLLSFIVPVADRNDVKESHPEIIYLEPKLFKSGTGFWDGTKKWKSIPVDTSADPEGVDKDANWWPNPDRFEKNAIVKGSKEFTDLTFTSSPSKYGREGFIQLGYYQNIVDANEYVSLETYQFTQNLDINDNHYIEKFTMVDAEHISSYGKDAYFPENYVQGEAAIFFNYVTVVDEEEVVKSIQLTDYASSFSIDETSKINISEKIEAQMIEEGSTQTEFENGSLEIRLKNKLNHRNTCVLLKDIKLETDSTNDKFKEQFTTASFSDATECILRESKVESANNYAYWRSNGKSVVKGIHLSKVIFCNFVYDSYEAKLGLKETNIFPTSKLKEYSKGKNRTLRWNVDTVYDDVHDVWKIVPETFECTILDWDKCPLAEELTIDDCEVDQNDGEVWFVHAKYYQYRDYGYSKMPVFLFGTDKTGRDMFKYVFEGLRTSLILGILTTVVCFLFGLAYGAISGYFGGTVDLVMERFTDILAGVPWIVVMTLVIIHLGSNFWTFAIALCLTGWIGTAATTRTQFYRFRGREYVLASRTLGASDARLIAKHILPNAMGTIITGAVLMVPSVIFSEATISYLGLGLKGLSSLGVILSNNQSELTTNPYLLIFPSVIIALLMISFNLFGNGLRDAVNPSLKGEEA